MELIPLSPLVSLLGAVAEPLAGAVALVVGCTTLIAGVGHYAGVLMEKSKTEIERMTAAGFFAGLTVSFLIVLVALII
jgi:hypothetical protein